MTSCGISTGFPVLSPTMGKVAHVLLTRSPLGTSLPCGRKALARLACVRHAASVNPEPGSNSPFDCKDPRHSALSLIDSQSLSHSSVVKVLIAFPHPGSSTACPTCGIPDCLAEGARSLLAEGAQAIVTLFLRRRNSALVIDTPSGDLQTPFGRRLQAGLASGAHKHTATGGPPNHPVRRGRLRRSGGRSWLGPGSARLRTPGLHPPGGRAPAW